MFRTREPDEYKAYVHQRNLTTKMIRKAKAEYRNSGSQNIGSHIPEFQLHTDVVPTEMVDIDITIHS